VQVATESVAAQGGTSTAAVVVLGLLVVVLGLVFAALLMSQRS
jgi:hypothetical protein